MRKYRSEIFLNTLPNTVVFSLKKKRFGLDSRINYLFMTMLKRWDSCITTVGKNILKELDIECTYTGVRDIKEISDNSKDLCC